MVDGKREMGSTLWRWVATAGGGDQGDLRNQATNGHLNARPGGFVRGHGNEERPPRRPAPSSSSTHLQRTAVDYGRYQLDDRPCTWGDDATQQQRRYYTLRFTGARGAGFLHVLQDGSLSADKETCSDDRACLFSFEPSPNAKGGWMVVRSVLTGGLLRMVDDYHPPYDGWDGVDKKAKAAPKNAKRLKAQRAAAEEALRGTAECPVRRASRKRGGGSPPAGWTYNASAYAGLVRRTLSPWYDGELSATAVDLGFFRDMYPYMNRYERPTLQLSILRDGVRFKWQPAAARKGEAPARPAKGGGPPLGSADREFVRMLSEAQSRVRLPEVEFVAHTASLPKVPAQNLELVLAPTADEAHNDVPVPSPWLYNESAFAASAAAATPPLSSCDNVAIAAKPHICVFASCRGPVDGYRGPLWRYYPPHRAALLAASSPALQGRLKVALLDGPCGGPPLEDLPLEAAWDQKAAKELRAEARAEAFLPSLLAKQPCSCPWELLLDEQGPPTRLVAAMRRGAVVFRQWSPYTEFFHARLEPWVHYIPVADNLFDLGARIAWADANPRRVAAIGAAGQLVATQLHAFEISCFWWQLLTALAPLENFEPRSNGLIDATAFLR